MPMRTLLTVAAARSDPAGPTNVEDSERSIDRSPASTIGSVEPARFRNESRRFAVAAYESAGTGGVGAG